MAEFKQIQEVVHKLAIEKGWHSVEATLTERIMLVVTELAEAVESIRNEEAAIWQAGESKDPLIGEHKVIKVYPNSPSWQENRKPEGVLVELADAVIRIMDIAQSQCWDLENAIRVKHKYNATRPYRHGGKAL